MGQLSLSVRAALAGVLCCYALGAPAQESGDRTVAPAVASKQAHEIAKGDPARWYRNDPTRQARLRTLQKEINAAYAEAKAACGKGPAAERASCLKDARATWQQDLANAPGQLENAPEASVTEKVTVTPEQR